MQHVNRVVLTLCALLGLAATFAVPAPAAAITAPAYSITEISIPGWDHVYATDINDKGQVVGVVMTNDWQTQPFLYDSNGIQLLGTPESGGYAKAINNAGQVVGQATFTFTTTSGEEEGQTETQKHAFLWSKDTGMLNLGNLGGRESEATDINDAGQVVGKSQTNIYKPLDEYDEFLETHAFLWSKDTGILDLDTLGVSSYYSVANSINDAGQIVGSFYPNPRRLDGTQRYTRAFLYDNNTGMSDLGTLAGGDNVDSRAESINGAGQVVGVTLGDRQRAFLYDSSGMRSLPDVFPETHASGAYHINDKGQVLGHWQLGEADNYRGGSFLYTDGKIVDFNTLLPADFGSFGPAASNNNGQFVITGQRDPYAPRDTPEGMLRSFILTPSSGGETLRYDEVSQELASGGTLSTDPEGDGATAADPVEAWVTTPNAGTVSIKETATTATRSTDFSFLTHQLDIHAPGASVESPLVLTFQIDKSLVDEWFSANNWVIAPGEDYSKRIEIFRNLVHIPDCGSTGGDPCVATRELRPDGDVMITVQSSHASIWNIGAVTSYTRRGFSQPVDMGIVNTAKSGATVPLKFELLAGSTELTDTRHVKTFTQSVSCKAGTPEDAIEQYASGATTLRYDPTAGQFVFNWKTPSGKAGSCYRVKVTTPDGASISADFKLK